MIFIRFFIFLFFYNFDLQNIYARVISPEYILNKRTKITPRLEDITARPLNFSKTNNLRRRPGSYFVAKGEFLILKGTVTDLLDNPISGVRINIWQADNFGYYKYLIAKKNNYAIYDVDFEGTGTAYTNNLGYYLFYTIFPGFYGHRTPHIHMLLSYKLFGQLETEVYFKHHPRNKIDKKLNSLSEKDRELLMCEVTEYDNFELKICNLDIKIDFINTK